MKIHGSVFKNKGRYWWKVKLPGEEKRKSIPLIPLGAKYATKNKAVALQIAKQMWSEKPKIQTDDARTILDLTEMYAEHCRTYYQNSREAENIGYALDFLLDNTNCKYAEDFGPLELQSVREKMIDKDLALSSVNRRIGMIKRMYRWATSQQSVPIHVYQALATVENLRAGRTRARATNPIKPVKECHVYAVLPYLSNVVADMVKLQLLTGMRSTEMCTMRPCDIDTAGKIWMYRPKEHKTSYRGHERLIAIGPVGQKILRAYLKREIAEYCFTPAEGAKQHKKYNLPCYNRNSYRLAIDRAIKAANKDGKPVPHWHPHQLRHTAGTKVRREYGKEAARAFLGHRNPKMTDSYAEIDIVHAKKAVLLLG